MNHERDYRIELTVTVEYRREGEATTSDLTQETTAMARAVADAIDAAFRNDASGFPLGAPADDRVTVKVYAHAARAWEVA